MASFARAISRLVGGPLLVADVTTPTIVTTVTEHEVEHIVDLDGKLITLPDGSAPQLFPTYGSRVTLLGPPTYRIPFYLTTISVPRDGRYYGYAEKWLLSSSIAVLSSFVDIERLR